MSSHHPLFPAKAGIQAEVVSWRGATTGKIAWVPAFAGKIGGKP